MKKSKEVTGFYRYVIDYENFKIISSNTYMYDQELIQKTNNKKGKELTGISNLSGAGIYMLSDGGYYVCGSQTEASAYGSSLDANTFMGTSYALRSIVVTRCNKNGEVLWSKLIPTGGSHNVSSSYYPELIGDELYLIFTDHKENLNATSMMEVKVADSSKKPKDIVVMLAILNPIGDLKKQIIHTSDEYVRIEPGNLFRPDKNEKKWLGSFSADGMFKESFVEIIWQ